MTAAAITIASALLIVFLGAVLSSWWDERLYRREQDGEPMSRLDRMDGLHDRDELWP